MDRWDDLTFLNKAKVCINGRITRTAIILLGKNEAEHYLSPASPAITWVLKDEQGIERDYEHFGPAADPGRRSGVRQGPEPDVPIPARCQPLSHGSHCSTTRG